MKNLSQDIAEMFADLAGSDGDAFDLAAYQVATYRTEYKRQWQKDAWADPVRRRALIAKSRERRAARPGFTKHQLGPVKARVLRELYADGVAPSALLRHFNISKTALRLIVTGVSHPHAGGPIRTERSERRAAGSSVATAKLTPFLVRLVRASKLSNRKLSALIGVHHATIGCARRGETWRSVE